MQDASNTRLEQLLALLTKHNCLKYKHDGLEIEFHVPVSSTPTQDASPSSPSLVSAIQEASQIQESKLPEDLRADDLMNFDKVLNWSGTPDQEAPLPLTGEI